MVNKVNKKLFLGILLTFIICIGSAIFAGYSTGPYGNYPNPGVHPGMIGPGIFNASGMANPIWVIPGILNMNNNRIINISTPTASSDVATKGYVDAASGNGGDYFVSMKCEGKVDSNNIISAWVVMVSDCPSGCTEIYYHDALNPDNSVVGESNYQKFGSIIIKRQKEFFWHTGVIAYCKQTGSIKAWDANTGLEYTQSSTIPEIGSSFRYGDCAVSCSIRVCSC